MADTGTEIIPASGSTPEQPRARRAHTYSRLTTAMAALALATSIYALLRIDSTRDRLDRTNDAARAHDAASAQLRADLKSLGNRQRAAARDLDRRVDVLEDVPKQVEELVLSVEQLRGRAEGPERAWSRAEAMFLLELGQRRLALDRDVQTAIVALESADARLAALRDQSTVPVRQQIARELTALRAVRQPDTVGVLSRLASAEEAAAHLPIKGVLAAERHTTDRAALPEGMFARAWAMTRNAFANLIVIRAVDDQAGSIVTADEAQVRRQHLQLLLFAARTAVARHDETAYREALAGARQWLGQFFELSSPDAQALLEQIQQLEPVDIDPQLPDISGSSRALQRLLPARPGPE
ncbi:MAG TPA: uroporphyrinogen-III C-methyltransferase [Steroidobacteraceae bacterium]|jgi:uroporphyrin-3 C-methyltransferase|nr:uroporphyrinogen-III C-methyltransferase [Steroidobacteraceae bacterium]